MRIKMNQYVRQQPDNQFHRTGAMPFPVEISGLIESAGINTTRRQIFHASGERFYHQPF
jgi:hypothetical protein